MEDKYIQQMIEYNVYDRKHFKNVCNRRQTYYDCIFMWKADEKRQMNTMGDKNVQNMI